MTSAGGALFFGGDQVGPSGTKVKRVDSFKLITQDLTWSVYISSFIVKTSQLLARCLGDTPLCFVRNFYTYTVCERITT